MKIFSIFAALVVLAGCTTASRRIPSLSVGMQEAEVVRILGWPRSTVKEGNVRVFHYKDDRGFRTYDYSFARFVDGRLESFGPETKDKQVTPKEPPLTK